MKKSIILEMLADSRVNIYNYIDKILFDWIVEHADECIKEPTMKEYILNAADEQREVIKITQAMISIYQETKDLEIIKTMVKFLHDKQDCFRQSNLPSFKEVTNASTINYLLQIEEQSYYNKNYYIPYINDSNIDVFMKNKKVIFNYSDKPKLMNLIYQISPENIFNHIIKNIHNLVLNDIKYFKILFMLVPSHQLNELHEFIHSRKFRINAFDIKGRIICHCENKFSSKSGYSMHHRKSMYKCYSKISIQGAVNVLCKPQSEYCPKCGIEAKKPHINNCYSEAVDIFKKEIRQLRENYVKQAMNNGIIIDQDYVSI